VLRFANEDINADIASVLDTVSAAYSHPDITALERAGGELVTHG
jgi:very-short-patch-repair endonuclease